MWSLRWESGGMMNDNSQQRALITVLFIPERQKGRKEGRTGRAQHFTAESWTETEKLQSSSSPPSLVIWSSQKKGLSSLFLDPPAPSPPPVHSKTWQSGWMAPRERRCGRPSRCAGRSAWGRPAARGSGQTASFHTGGGSSRKHGAWTGKTRRTFRTEPQRKGERSQDHQFHRRRLKNVLTLTKSSFCWLFLSALNYNTAVKYKHNTICSCNFVL